jgi:hypothetical protein
VISDLRRLLICPNLPLLLASQQAHSSFHFEPVRRAAGAVWRAEPLADDAFEPFSNVVTSRSMNHKGVEFLILARPGRDQWTVVISYPRSTSPTKVPFEGSRDKAIAVARAEIDGWLKKTTNT